MTGRNDSGKHPRVFISYAHDSDQLKELVLAFATLLRGAGIDARLDRWAEASAHDWPAWIERQLLDADFVLVIASPEYLRRAEGGIASDAGLGVQFEASLLRNLIYKDPGTWRQKILTVVLPGRSIDETPSFLLPRSASYYQVNELIEESNRELLAVLCGQQLHILPALGPAPAAGVGAGWPTGAGADRAHDQVVDDLALSVARQWRDEEERLLVADPWPLPLRWSVTTHIEAMAGVSWKSVGLVAPEALDREFCQDGEASPDGEPAKDRQPTEDSEPSRASELIARVPSRRLVVLGSAGAGKSVLAIQLVRDLLAARSPGDPVPVLLPMGGWNPAEQHLSDWMTARLAQDYPGLRQQAESKAGSRTTLAAALVSNGRIVPILDGLDEVNEQLRDKAIVAINRLGSTVPLVVTSRDTEYEHAVCAAGRGLTRAAVVELHPLEPADVRGYLRELGGPEDRWWRVIRKLDDDPDGALSRTLRVPLMLWLARTVYADPASDPGELCDHPTSSSVEAHLFGGLVPALYPHHPIPPGRTKAFRNISSADAQRWLAFVASHLRTARTPDLAWWRLQRAVPPVIVGSRFLTGATMGFGLGQLLGNITTGLVSGSSIGLLMASKRLSRRIGLQVDHESPHRFKVSSARIRNEVRNALAVPLQMIGVLVVALAVAVWQLWKPTGVLPIAGLSALILVGFGHTVWYGLIRSKPLRPGIVSVAELDQVARPQDALRDDRKQVLVQAVPLLVLSGVLLLAGAGTVSVAVGAFGAAWFFSSAYSRFAITRFVLALGDRLPWRTMAFLDDAHRRGMLRLVGAEYQFRNLQIQDRLAGSTDR